jgi:CxxC motif-containing protein
MKELICIVCPKGCHLKVDENNDYKVTGNGCERGVEYGKNELVNPMRVITSTVKIEGALHRRCPVKTNTSIPKGKMMEVVKELDSVTLKSPVNVGDVVIKNVADTGADIVSTKSM